MNVTLTLDSLFCIVSMVVGIFLTIIFLKLSSRNRIANRILAIFYFLMSIAIGCNPLLFSSLYIKLPHLIRIEWIIFSLIRPLMHLYYIAFVYNKIRLKLPDIALFVLTGVFITSMLPFYIQSPAAKIAYYRTILKGNFYVSDVVYTVIIAVLSVLFFIRTTHIIRDYTKKIKQHFSSIERLTSFSLNSGLVSFLVFIICIITILILLAVGQPYHLVYKIIPLMASGSVFFFGFTGVVQQEVHLQFSKIYSLSDGFFAGLEENAHLCNRIRNYIEKKKTISEFRPFPVPISQGIVPVAAETFPDNHGKLQFEFL